MENKEVWRKLELVLEENERLKTRIKELEADCKYFLSKIPDKQKHQLGGKNE